ncbi:MAG: hypothetical protein AAB553_05155 [Patescibacteria group bacterium]
MVTKEQLEEFQEIYFQKYNIRLSNEEATEQANALLNLMKILLKPDTKKA